MANVKPTSQASGVKGGHSPSFKKRKRAHDEGAGLPPHKKAKSDRKSNKLSSDGAVTAIDEGDFSRVSAMMRLSLAPVFLENPVAGLMELLDTLVMRWVIAFPSTFQADAKGLSSYHAYWDPFMKICASLPRCSPHSFRLTNIGSESQSTG